MTKYRIISLLLIAVSIATIGCTNTSISDNPSTTVEAPSTETEVSTADETTTAPAPQIEAIDKNGAEYTILSQAVGGYTFPYNEFFAEEQTGDTINDAVYDRNAWIEEKYNITFNMKTDNSVASVAKRSVLAGDSEYDLIVPKIADAFSLSLQGVLQDISTIPHIDLAKPWWMKSMVDNTSIGEKNYFLSGDLNLSVLNGVGVVYFNKNLAEKQGIDDLYQTVRDGNWTIDTLMAYCKGITQDINGDSIYNGDDMFGLTCNAFVWQPLYYGSGSMIIEKDADDMPKLAWGSEKNIGIMTKLIDFLNDKSSTILVNQFPELQDAGGWGNASIKMFTEDRALFWIEIIYGSLTLRDMNTDFGLLPMPKYDANQEDYATYIHVGLATACGIPSTNNDLDFTGRILEDMAYQSYITVRPAYYETTLKGKISRDQDSAEMLDIIYRNINIDLALVMNTSGLPIDKTMRAAMINNSSDLVSQIAAQQNACESIISQNTQKILALDH